jgi:hypothetical protein
MSKLANVLSVAVLVLGLGAVAAGCGGGETPEDVGIPIYEPSDVVSEETGSTVLTSPDSVDEISQFYLDFVEREDWETVSETVRDDGASLTIRKDGDGATIAIGPHDPDTLISISTYASP